MTLLKISIVDASLKHDHTLRRMSAEAAMALCFAVLLSSLGHASEPAADQPLVQSAQVISLGPMTTKSYRCR